MLSRQFTCPNPAWPLIAHDKMRYLSQALVTLSSATSHRCPGICSATSRNIQTPLCATSNGSVRSCPIILWKFLLSEGTPLHPIRMCLPRNPPEDLEDAHYTYSNSLRGRRIRRLLMQVVGASGDCLESKRRARRGTPCCQSRSDRQQKNSLVAGRTFVSILRR